MKARVIFRVSFDVSYIAEVKDLSEESAVQAILRDDFDISNWESDPSFYENLWDALKHYTLIDVKAIEE